MIFISYTGIDETIVEPIAQKIETVFGKENIFFDKWSIQPGDGIIEKMNEGLEKCKFFFFFISKNSLEREMVKLEWQNAIIKMANSKELKFIPVKLDDCMIPDILLQNLYIDYYGKGQEVCIRQIIDVINGSNTYRPDYKLYENIRGYVTHETKELKIEFRAETYLEPISRFLILLENKKDEIEYKCLSDSIYSHHFKENIQLDSGMKTNAFFVSVERGTAPGFPLTIKLIQKMEEQIKLRGLMHAVKENKYSEIPLIYINQ
jgi:hypothetical protein